MRALIACALLCIAGVAGGAPAQLPAAPAATARLPARAAPAPTTRPIALGVARPSGARPAPSSIRSNKTAPAALGGAAKYDAKKGAMLGGTVMPHRP
jgi:hypothetical protein